MNAPDETAHAMELLRDIPSGWTGKRAVVPIDPVCRFNRSCNVPLSEVIVFQMEGEAHCLALCERHTKVMADAIDRWREMA